MSRPRVDVTCGPGVLGCLRPAGGLLCVLVVIAVVLVSEPVRHLAGVSTADELVQDGIYGIAALIVLARAALVQLKEPAGGVLPAHSARVGADRCCPERCPPPRSSGRNSAAREVSPRRGQVGSPSPRTPRAR